MENFDFLVDEVSGYFGADESCDLMGILSDIDENDLIFHEDEGNTSNATNFDTDSSHSETEDIESERKNNRVSFSPVTTVHEIPPSIGETPSNTCSDTMYSSSDIHVDTKKRKFEIPSFPNIMPAFQPNFFTAMHFLQSQLQLGAPSLPSTYSNTVPVAAFHETEPNKNIKKEIRRMKNREAADKSRMKKKTVAETLAQEVEILRNEIQKLNERLAATRAENTSLKSHNSFLQQLLTNSSQNFSSRECYYEGQEKLPFNRVATTGVGLLGVAFIWVIFNDSSPSLHESLKKSQRHGRILLTEAEAHSAFHMKSALVFLRSSVHVAWPLFLRFGAFLVGGISIIIIGRKVYYFLKSLRFLTRFLPAHSKTMKSS